MKDALRIIRKREKKAEENKEKIKSEDKENTNNQDLKGKEVEQENQRENIEIRRKTNMDYQISMDKYRNCKDCILEKETLEEQSSI